MSNRHEFANCIDIMYEILKNVQKCTALLLVMLLVKLAILVKKRVPFRGVRGGTLWHFLAQTYPWDHLARRKNVHQNGHEHVTFVIFC